MRVKARRRTPWGQIVLAAFLLVLLFLVLRLFATNPNMRWDIVGKYLFESTVLQGVWTTIELTVISTILAVALGIGLALLQQSSNPVAAAFASIYVWYFRAVPLLVQLHLLLQHRPAGAQHRVLDPSSPTLAGRPIPTT